LILKGEISWVTSSHFEPMTRAGHIGSNQPTLCNQKEKKEKMSAKFNKHFTHFAMKFEKNVNDPWTISELTTSATTSYDESCFFNFTFSPTWDFPDLDSVHSFCLLAMPRLSKVYYYCSLAITKSRGGCWCSVGTDRPNTIALSLSL
jgi:hypothetical protein